MTTTPVAARLANSSDSTELTSAAVLRKPPRMGPRALDTTIVVLAGASAPGSAGACALTLPSRPCSPAAWSACTPVSVSGNAHCRLMPSEPNRFCSWPSSAGPTNAPLTQYGAAFCGCSSTGWAAVGSAVQNAELSCRPRTIPVTTRVSGVLLAVPIFSRVPTCAFSSRAVGWVSAMPSGPRRGMPWPGYWPATSAALRASGSR
jgi:hypothetical protein